MRLPAQRMGRQHLQLSQFATNTQRIYSQTPANTACLFTTQPSLVLTAPTHGGMAGLSSPGWLVLHPDDLPALKRLPIMLLLTRPDVEQPRYHA